VKNGESVAGVGNTAAKLPGFERKELPDGYFLWEGRLREPLIPNAVCFEALWRLHPIEFHEIKMHGRLVKTSRPMAWIIDIPTASTARFRSHFPLVLASEYH